MSSHHIVREKQEPALFILDFAAFGEEHLGQLLEWSPTLMVSADAVEKVVSLDVKIDIVLGVKPPVGLQEHTLFVLAKGDVLNVGMTYLIGEKYPAVNVIGSNEDFSQIAGYSDKINWVWFTDQLKTYPIKSGFSFWKPAGTKLKIAGLETTAIQNLRLLPNNDFEVIEDGFVGFEFKNEPVFISEYL